MQDIADLYKGIFKHLRVIRNVSRSHKEAIQSSFVDYDKVTPYERGRLTRSCTRLGQDLRELIHDHKQVKVAFFILAYVDAMKVGPGAYCKPGNNYWTSLRADAMEQCGKDQALMAAIANVFHHIASMLDQPLAKVPSRMMLMRLAIP